MTLAKKAVRGTIFVGASNYLIYLITFAGSVFLARLLPPEFFGVIALSQFFLGLSGRIKEIGLEQALIYRQENWQRFAANHFSLQLLFGAAVILLNSLLSIPVGLYYGSVTGWVLFVSGLFGTLGAFSVTFAKILEKELMFKQSTLIDILVAVVSQAGMVVMAWQGLGIWSLVAGGLPGALLNTYLVWRICPVKIRLRWDKEVVKWFFRFGPWWHWLFSATASLIILQFNNFLVGTLLSVTVLGFYARAYSWATLPTSRIAAIISRVAYPVYAKLQTKREGLSRAYSLTLSVIVRVTLPVSILALLIIKEATLLLIGEKWLPLVPMFQALVLYMVMRPLFDDTGALFTAVGKPRVINSVQVVQAVLILALNPVLVRFWGGIGAAVGAGLAMLAGVLLLYRRLVEIVDVRLGEILFRPVLAILGALAFLSWSLGYMSVSPLTTETLVVSLVIKTLFFSFAYLLLLVLLEYRRWVGYKEYLLTLLRK